VLRLTEQLNNTKNELKEKNNEYKWKDSSQKNLQNEYDKLVKVFDEHKAEISVHQDAAATLQARLVYIYA